MSGMGSQRYYERSNTCSCKYLGIVIDDGLTFDIRQFMTNSIAALIYPYIGPLREYLGFPKSRRWNFSALAIIDYNVLTYLYRMDRLV